LIAQDPTVAEWLAIPAVKCKAYSAISIRVAGGIQLVLAGATEQLKQAYPDFELREYVSEYVPARVQFGQLQEFEK
jgi:hypothetical protein